MKHTLSLLLLVLPISITWITAACHSAELQAAQISSEEMQVSDNTSNTITIETNGVNITVRGAEKNPDLMINGKSVKEWESLERTTGFSTVIPAHFLSAEKITEDFLERAFPKKYFWVKKAVAKNVHGKPRVKKVAYADYPIENPHDLEFLPSTELPINRIVKWSKKEPITFSVKGDSVDPAIAGHSFEEIKSLFETKVDPYLKQAGIQVEMIIPIEGASDRDTSAAADLTAIFTGFSGGIRGKTTVNDMKSFIETHTLFDSFEVHFTLPWYSKYVHKNVANDGVFYVSPDGDVEAAMCNKPATRQAAPTFEFIYICILSSLGLVGYDGIVEYPDYDALLLKILYDPRIENGMTKQEVRPLVQQIAREQIESLKAKRNE